MQMYIFLRRTNSLAGKHFDNWSLFCYSLVTKQKGDKNENSNCLLFSYQ